MTVRNNEQAPRESPPVGVVFGARLRETRRALEISQQALSAELHALGVRISRETLAKIETDPERAANIKLVDALAICVALGVQPSRLLSPREHGQPMAITPTLIRPAGNVRGWLHGQWPLQDSAAGRRRFFIEEVDEDELEQQALEAQHRGPEAGLPASLAEAHLDATDAAERQADW